MAWSAESASIALRGAGVVVDASDVRLEPRSHGRQFTHLPAHRMAWFADSEEGRVRLALERRVLHLIRLRCTFRVPRILHEAADASFDIRAAVPGLVDPWALYERVKTDSGLAQRHGHAIGAILVEQHTRVGADEAAGWLPVRPSWPEPVDWIRGRLPRVVADRDILPRIDALLARCEAVTTNDEDRVLIHGDLGLHNVAVDRDTSAVLGVFDYEGAAWADRHYDFRYLLFDLERHEMLSAALAVYEPAVGHRLSRERIALYNAACAASFLALRDGVSPDDRSCGRTLAEDLRWMSVALARVGT